MATRQPTFNRIPQTANADDFIAQIEELARRNAGGFTAVGQDVTTNLPFTPSSGFRTQRELSPFGFYANPQRPTALSQFDPIGDNMFTDTTTGEDYSFEDLQTEIQNPVAGNRGYQAPAPAPQPVDDFDSDLLDDIDQDPEIAPYIAPRVSNASQAQQSTPTPQGQIMGAQAPARPSPQAPRAGRAPLPLYQALASQGVGMYAGGDQSRTMASRPTQQYDQPIGPQRMTGPTMAEGRAYQVARGVDPKEMERFNTLGRDQYIEEEMAEFRKGLDQREEGIESEFAQERDKRTAQELKLILEQTAKKMEDERFDADQVSQKVQPQITQAPEEPDLRSSVGNVFSKLNPIKPVSAAERPLPGQEENIPSREPGMFNFSIPRAGEGIQRLQDEIQPKAEAVGNLFSKLKDQPFKRIGEASASITEGVDDIGGKVKDTITDVGNKAEAVKGGVLSAVNNAKNVITGGGTKNTKIENRGSAPKSGGNNNSTRSTPAPRPTSPAPAPNKSVARPAPAPAPNKSVARPYSAPKPAPAPAPKQAPRPAPAKPAPAPAPKNIFGKLLKLIFR